MTFVLELNLNYIILIYNCTPEASGWPFTLSFQQGQLLPKIRTQQQIRMTKFGAGTK
jgi:hypothetical protein